MEEGRLVDIPACPSDGPVPVRADSTPDPVSDRAPHREPDPDSAPARA
jgi:hypothetical protein